MIKWDDVQCVNKKNTNKDIKVQIRRERANNIGNIYKVNAHMHCLYTRTLFVKLVKLFETLWDKRQIKQYIINATTILHACVSI